MKDVNKTIRVEKVFKKSNNWLGQFSDFIRSLYSAQSYNVTSQILLRCCLYCWHVGYDANINPSVANSFATAAFRFGHSQIQSMFEGRDVNYNAIGGIPLSAVK